MKAIRAHVRNGQIVPDEPVELPDGTVVEVMVVDELSPEDLEELDREVELSKQEIARGEYVDGLEFARKLATRP